MIQSLTGISIEEAARRADVHESVIRAAIRNGQLDVLRFGPFERVRSEDIDKFAPVVEERGAQRSPGFHLGPEVVRPKTIGLTRTHTGTSLDLRPTVNASDIRMARRGEQNSVLPLTMAGYLSVFDQPATIRSEGAPFVEIIRKGAFRRAFEDPTGIKVLYQHGRSHLLEQRQLGVITDLREDDYGARYAVRMFDTPSIRELLPALGHPGTMGASFGFSILRERFNDHPGKSEHNPRGLPLREVLDLHLSEFSAVENPAYAAASAGLAAAGGEAPASSAPRSKTPSKTPRWYLG